MKHWRRIYEKYGSVHIEILGGEPFIYPNFVELIEKISHLHTIGITTNLSVNINSFIEKINPSQVRVSPTFHPLFAKYEEFLKKVLFLKENGFCGDAIWYLAYPPQIRQIDHYKEKFNQEGLSLSLMTFWGEYKGGVYPQSYTEEERRMISSHLGKRGGEEYQVIPKKMPKGRLCRAGQKYAVIQANGNVIRCGGSELNEIIGNFFDENFKLLQEPIPCKAEYCKCNEWALLLCEEEELQKPKEKKKGKRQDRFRKQIPPHRVFFTWDIHYLCNYQCTYCNALKPGDSNFIEAIYLDVDQWIEIWNGIYDSYGSCEIQLTGGEPFTYPSIMDLITKLSKIHTLEFSTNFSWDIEPFIKNIPPNRARVGISFHPEFADFKEFLDKASELKKGGFEVWVNYVAYPPLLEGMAKYKQEVEKLGICFSILPFTGTYEGRSYPAEYTEEERKFLLILGESDIVNKKTIDWKLEKGKNITKGKLCRMGQMYAKIHPNGDTYRCCGDGGSGCLGNLIKGTFRLLDSPSPCECNQCPCWRCMLVGEEQNWLGHWVIPR
jgi:MoaA/NifB/PqqE/SkfB family radical SAM enzyme